MTFEPLVNMPAPTAMQTSSMVRAHAYNVLCQTKTALFNYYVMNNNNFLATATNRAVDVLAAEMQELLPGLLSTSHISTVGGGGSDHGGRGAGSGSGQSSRNSSSSSSSSTGTSVPTIVSATAVAPSSPGGGVLPLSAGMWLEEPYKTRDGVNASYLCIRIVVVNGAATPVTASVVMDGVVATGLPGGRPAQRIFGSIYSVNLAPAVAATAGGTTRWEGRRDGGGGSKGLVVLTDIVDGWGANVYQIGCEMLPPANKDNLAANGNFEQVQLSKPTEFIAGGGEEFWHVYAPDGPMESCSAALSPHATPTGPAAKTSCAVSSHNYTDDRARITADAADCFEG